MARVTDLAPSKDPETVESFRKEIIVQCEDAKSFLANDRKTSEIDYASRDPFVALVQTNMGKEAHKTDAPAMANLANDWQQFGDVDPRWTMCPIVSFFTWKEPKAPFVASPDPNAYTYVEHRAKFTIAIMADWGAANQSARDVSAHIRERNPDYVIHLGDIYYAGQKLSVRRLWTCGS